MRDVRVRYPEAPSMVYQSPTCSACYVELDHNGDGWECRVCRTSWDDNDYDTPGQLYPDWTGEEWPVDLEVTDLEDGHKVGLAIEREEREERLRKWGLL